MSMHDDAQPAVPEPELTKFQLRILAILAEEARYGLAVKEELEDYYGSNVNHGRLYPNLDDLIEAGLVEKSELDKRTNEYAITQRGEHALHKETEWLLERTPFSVVDESDDPGWGGDD